jgi:hypothetical protein
VIAAAQNTDPNHTKYIAMGRPNLMAYPWLKN